MMIFSHGHDLLCIPPGFGPFPKLAGVARAGITAWILLLTRRAGFWLHARRQKSPHGQVELTDAIDAIAATGQPLAGLKIQACRVDVGHPEVLAKLRSGS